VRLEHTEKAEGSRDRSQDVSPKKVEENPELEEAFCKKRYSLNGSSMFREYRFLQICCEHLAQGYHKKQEKGNHNKSKPQRNWQRKWRSRFLDIFLTQREIEAHTYFLP
jgi:hypothetical protein